MIAATFRRAKEWGKKDALDDAYWDFTDYGWGLAASIYVALAPLVGMIVVSFVLPKDTESESGLLKETRTTGVPAGLSRGESIAKDVGVMRQVKPQDGFQERVLEDETRKRFKGASQDQIVLEEVEQPMIRTRREPASSTVRTFRGPGGGMVAAI